MANYDLAYKPLSAIDTAGSPASGEGLVIRTSTGAPAVVSQNAAMTASNSTALSFTPFSITSGTQAGAVFTKAQMSAMLAVLDSVVDVVNADRIRMTEVEAALVKIRAVSS